MRTFPPFGPESGLLRAWLGGPDRFIEPESIADANSADASWRWLHLDGNRPATAEWLRQAAADDQEVIDTLLAPTTRPRCEVSPERVVFVGRGVNLNPGAAPEDMVSVRFWLQQDRLVTVSLRPVRATDDIAERLLKSTKGIASPGLLAVAINERLAERMNPTLDGIAAELDEVYSRVIDENDDISTTELVPIRSRTIQLHRYVFPLSLEMEEFAEADCDWLDESFRGAARGVVDRLKRLSEDLAAFQSRGALARDEIVSQSSERLNQRVYALTLLTAVFLPLTVLTGMLGMNVGGIPFADTGLGFWVTIGIFLAFVGGELLLLKALRWF